jgi:hypothetical protein
VGAEHEDGGAIEPDHLEAPAALLAADGGVRAHQLVDCPKTENVSDE